MDQKKYKLRRNITLIVAAIGVIILVVCVFFANTTAQEVVLGFTGASITISGMQLAFKNRGQYECQDEDGIKDKEEVNKNLKKRRILFVFVTVISMCIILIALSVHYQDCMALIRSLGITENNIKYTVKTMIILAQLGITMKCIFSDKKSMLDDAIAMLIMLGLCALNLSID